MKCHCGDEATCKVTVKGMEWYKFYNNSPSCKNCAERTTRSHGKDKVTIKDL